MGCRMKGIRTSSIHRTLLEASFETFFFFAYQRFQNLIIQQQKYFYVSVYFCVWIFQLNRMQFGIIDKMLPPEFDLYHRFRLKQYIDPITKSNVFQRDTISFSNSRYILYQGSLCSRIRVLIGKPLFFDSTNLANIKNARYIFNAIY